MVKIVKYFCFLHLWTRTFLVTVKEDNLPLWGYMDTHACNAGSEVVLGACNGGSEIIVGGQGC